jgi:hypothetical protein
VVRVRHGAAGRVWLPCALWVQPHLAAPMPLLIAFGNFTSNRIPDNK